MRSVCSSVVARLNARTVHAYVRIDAVRTPAPRGRATRVPASTSVYNRHRAGPQWKVTRPPRRPRLGSRRGAAVCRGVQRPRPHPVLGYGPHHSLLPPALNPSMTPTRNETPRCRRAVRACTAAQERAREAPPGHAAWAALILPIVAAGTIGGRRCKPDPMIGEHASEGIRDRRWCGSVSPSTPQSAATRPPRRSSHPA